MNNTKLFLVLLTASFSFVACNPKKTTTIEITNPTYQLFLSDSTLYNALPLECKYVVCSFNKPDTLIAEDLFSFSDCKTKKVTFSADKESYFLYYNSLACTSLGSTTDLTYWNKNKEPIFRFIESYNPLNNKISQSFIFYKDSIIEKSVRRSKKALSVEELKGASFEDYSPSPLEREIEGFPKK